MASQNKTENLGLCQFGNDDIPDWRTDYTGDMAIIDKRVKDLSEKDSELSKEIENVKKSVSDRNTKIATAITEKGVATEPTDSADVMANNIKSIPTGSGSTISVMPKVDVVKSTTVSAMVIGKVTHEIVNE